MKYCSIGVVHYAQTDDFGTRGINRSEAMKISLESLFANTDYPAEIIVMDNGGNPDDTDWLVQKTREGKIHTLVRYSNNMSFAFAWNQFARIATGDYLCFTCNDIKYKEGWLSACINLLEKYSDRKLIATPYLTPDKDQPNLNKEVLEDARINSMAGSNCFIITPENWKEIGQFPHHRISGSIWHRLMAYKGYQVIVPLVDMVEHLAWRRGVAWRNQIKIERQLIGGEVVDFHYKDYRKHIFRGHQKNAGYPI